MSQGMRTQVGIVGAGPAVLSHLLHWEGIDSVVLEAHTREYVQERVRAGVLEQNTVDLLTEIGVGARMQREGLIHHGVELRFQGRRQRVDFRELTGRAITIYAQGEVVKDRIDARLAAGGSIFSETDDVSVQDFDNHSADHKPSIRYRRNGNSLTFPATSSRAATASMESAVPSFRRGLIRSLGSGFRLRPRLPQRSWSIATMTGGLRSSACGVRSSAASTCNALPVN